VIFASHELDRARAHSTREVQMRGGQIISSTPSSDRANGTPLTIAPPLDPPQAAGDA
jgi:energy-coupling factor transporter ATP-binding protein EcfA2